MWPQHQVSTRSKGWYTCVVALLLLRVCDVGGTDPDDKWIKTFQQGDGLSRCKSLAHDHGATPDVLFAQCDFLSSEFDGITHHNHNPGASHINSIFLRVDATSGSVTHKFHPTFSNNDGWDVEVDLSAGGYVYGLYRAWPNSEVAKLNKADLSLVATWVSTHSQSGRDASDYGLSLFDLVIDHSRSVLYASGQEWNKADSGTIYYHPCIFKLDISGSQIAYSAKWVNSELCHGYIASAVVNSQGTVYAYGTSGCSNVGVASRSNIPGGDTLFVSVHQASDLAPTSGKMYGTEVTTNLADNAWYPFQNDAPVNGNRFGMMITKSDEEFIFLYTTHGCAANSVCIDLNTKTASIMSVASDLSINWNRRFPRPCCSSEFRHLWFGGLDYSRNSGHIYVGLYNYDSMEYYDKYTRHASHTHKSLRQLSLMELDENGLPRDVVSTQGNYDTWMFSMTIMTTSAGNEHIFMSGATKDNLGSNTNSQSNAEADAYILRASCNAGKSSKITTTACTECWVGQRAGMLGTKGCIRCGYGEYTDSTPVPSDCKKCAIGTYSMTRSANSCKACPAGTTTKEVGSTTLGHCCSGSDCQGSSYSPVVIHMKEKDQLFNISSPNQLHRDIVVLSSDSAAQIQNWQFIPWGGTNPGTECSFDGGGTDSINAGYVWRGAVEEWGCSDSQGGLNFIGSGGTGCPVTSKITGLNGVFQNDYTASGVYVGHIDWGDYNHTPYALADIDKLAALLEVFSDAGGTVKIGSDRVEYVAADSRSFQLDACQPRGETLLSVTVPGIKRFNLRYELVMKDGTVHSEVMDRKFGIDLIAFDLEPVALTPATMKSNCQYMDLEGNCFFVRDPGPLESNHDFYYQYHQHSCRQVGACEVTPRHLDDLITMIALNKDVTSSGRIFFGANDAFEEGVFKEMCSNGERFQSGAASSLDALKWIWADMPGYLLGPQWPDDASFGQDFLLATYLDPIVGTDDSANRKMSSTDMPPVCFFGTTAEERMDVLPHFSAYSEGNQVTGSTFPAWPSGFTAKQRSNNNFSDWSRKINGETKMMRRMIPASLVNGTLSLSPEGAAGNHSVYIVWQGDLANKKLVASHKGGGTSVELSAYSLSRGASYSAGTGELHLNATVLRDLTNIVNINFTSASLVGATMLSNHSASTGPAVNGTNIDASLFGVDSFLSLVNLGIQDPTGLSATSVDALPNMANATRHYFKSDSVKLAGGASFRAVCRYSASYDGSADAILNQTILSLDGTSQWLRVDVGTGGVLRGSCLDSSGNIRHSSSAAAAMAPLQWYDIEIDIHNYGVLSIFLNGEPALVISGCSLESGNYNIYLGSAPERLWRLANGRDDYLNGQVATFAAYGNTLTYRSSDGTLLFPFVSSYLAGTLPNTAGSTGCDDGNGIANDGCSVFGQVEESSTCLGSPSVCIRIISTTQSTFSTAGGEKLNMTISYTNSPQEHLPFESVLVGGSPCSGLTSQDNTTIACDLSAGEAGLQTITFVSSVRGQFNISGKIEYMATPTVRAVDPSVSFESGGGLVDIYGDGVGGLLTTSVAKRASLGENVCRQLKYINSTAVRCLLPINLSGKGTALDVTLTTAGGTASLAGGFRVEGAPPRDAVQTVSVSSPGRDQVHTIVADTARTFLAGDTDSAMPGAPETNQGGTDAFLMATSVTGTTLWSRMYGTSGDDAALGIAVSRENGTVTSIFLAGYVSQSYDPLGVGGTSVLHRGGKDALLMRINEVGDVVWSIQFGTGADDSLKVVTVTEAGILAAGETRGTLTNPGSTDIGHVDCTLALVNADTGALSWTRQWGGTSNDNDSILSVSSFGNRLYVSGSVVGLTNFPGATGTQWASPLGGPDGFTLGFDSFGSPLGAFQPGIEREDYFTAIAADENGLYASLRYKTFSSNWAYYLVLVDVDSRNGKGTIDEGVTDHLDNVADTITLDTTGIYLSGYSTNILPGGCSDGTDFFIRKVFKSSVPGQTIGWTYTVNYCTRGSVVPKAIAVNAQSVVSAVIATAEPSGVALTSEDIVLYDLKLNNAGSEATSHNTSTLCAPGTFSAAPGSLMCRKCLPGTVSASHGATACSSCESGYVSEQSGLAGCTACPAGSFSEVSRSRCVVCLPGTYAPSAGLGSCLDCPAGTYSNHGATACIPCPPGTVGKLPRASSCSKCLPGAFSDESGATACKNCEKGTFASAFNSTQCTKCPGGTFGLTAGAQDSSAGCGPCEAGSVSTPARISCVACPAGTFQNRTGQEVCMPCAAGTFNSVEGRQSCLQCKPGSEKPFAGAGVCSPCPKGSYTEDWGSDACDVCPLGSTTTSEGAISQSFCRCPKGSFGDPLKGVPCISCPGDGVKTSCTGATGYPESLPGYYVARTNTSTLSADDDAFATMNAHLSTAQTMSTDSSVPTVHYCSPESACLGGSASCDKGYEDTACRSCQDGYFRSNGRCDTCGEMTILSSLDLNLIMYSVVPAAAVSGWAVIVVGIPAGIIFVQWTRIVVEKFKRTNPGKRTAQLANQTRLLGAYIPFLIRFLQRLNTVLSMPITWPTLVSALSYATVPLAIDIFSILRLGCSDNRGDYAVRFYGRLAPFLLIEVSLVIAWVVFKIVNNGWWLFCCKVPLKYYDSLREIMQHSEIIATQYSLKFASLFYLQIIALFWEPFVCYEQTDGEYYLIAEPSVRCFTLEETSWLATVPVAIAGILLVGGGVPALFLIIIYRYRFRALSNETIRQKVGWIWADYRIEYAFWPVFETLSNFGFVFVMTMSIFSIQDQLTSMLFISFFMLICRAWTKPFESTGRLNESSIFADFSIFMLLLSGMLKRAGVSTNTVDSTFESMSSVGVIMVIFGNLAAIVAVLAPSVFKLTSKVFQVFRQFTPRRLKAFK